MSALRPQFWKNYPLDQLTSPEWEALCDGCGLCCLVKLQDEDNGEVVYTKVACQLLDTQTAQCSDYANRKRQVPDCVRLTPRLAASLTWLPDTCAYRLRARGKPLPAWHHLLSADPEAVHAAGISVRGKVIGEQWAGPLEDHIILPPGVEVARDEDGA